MARLTVAVFFLIATSFGVVSHAQDCSPPKIIANSNSLNLFTPEQEMIVGDLTFQRLFLETRFVSDEKLIAFITGIGEKLAKHLPPTGLHYKFHIVDDGETNAYSIPGGHVLVTRKLIAFANNEDELAGVIAHELGHATVHHSAVDLSERMRKVLNISSLGDRKDVTEKYNLLIENIRTKRISRSRGHVNEQQLEADKIGLFALVAAGYQAESFTSSFDRLTENEGRTGSWFSDIFGNTKPETKRVREMMQLTNQLPQACRDNRVAVATSTFLDWQASVVSFRDKARKESLPGLMWRRELTPKLNSDVTHLAYSGDGRFLLAQTDFAIAIIDRESAKFLFHIPAEDAQEASFTPDGRQVVFVTGDLRFERWDIGEQRPLEVRELILRRDCWESSLSPDGNHLACIDTATNVRIIETKTGKKIFEKEKFYPLTAFEFFYWLSSSRSDDRDKTNFFRIEFSPDSRFALFSRSDRFRFRIRIDVQIVDESENEVLAVDLNTLKKIDVGGGIKKLAKNAFAFLDNERVVGIPDRSMDEAGVFSFPDGKRVKKFSLWARIIKRTENPDYVIVKPLQQGGLGFFNIRSGELASGMMKSDATIWKNLSAFEGASGKLVIQEVAENPSAKKFDSKNPKTIDLPVSTFGNLQTAEVADNFAWLLASSKSRGAMWNLTTGERKLFMRGFRGGVIASDGIAVTEFPKLDETPHSLVYLDPNKNITNPIRELDRRGSRQHGRFILNRTSLNENSKKEAKREKEMEKERSKFLLDEDDFGDSVLDENVRFEITDIVNNSVVFNREFKKSAPPYTFDSFSGRLVLYWQLGSEIGKTRLNDFPLLKQKAASLGNKVDDYLIEIFDAYNKTDLGAFLLETGRGSFDVGSGVSEGDWLMFFDTDSRILVYSIKTGDLKHRFFGRDGLLNPRLNMIAVESFPGVVNLFSLESGEKIGGFEIDGQVVFMRFDLSGVRLFVLSNNQIAYAFDLRKMPRTKSGN